MKIACYTDIHNQEVMLNLPTVLRGSAVTAARLTAAEWGQADLAIVGGDNLSDYPYWNRSCALPYRNWLDIKAKITANFAAVAKGERVLYVDGNNDMILGDLPTAENPPYNTCEFYTSPMKQTLGALSPADYIGKIAASKGPQAGEHLLAFHYVVDGVDFFGINLDPDTCFNSHDGYYNADSLRWLGEKLDEVDPEGNKLLFVVGHLSATTLEDDTTHAEDMGPEQREPLYAALQGHRNLFYLYGHVHGQHYVHRQTAPGILPIGVDGQLMKIPAAESDSRQLLGEAHPAFYTVHMGGLRPFVKWGAANPLEYFENDPLTGVLPGGDTETTCLGTATPRLAQYLLIETHPDRVVFAYRNTGTYPGYTTADKPAPFTVYLQL